MLSDKCPEFAADVMTMVSFTEPWGFVQHSRDEGHLLGAWREGLPYFGFGVRSRWYRNTILKSPTLAPWFLPKTSDASGMGFLMAKARHAVLGRERLIEESGFTQDQPDVLQQ